MTIDELLAYARGIKPLCGGDASNLARGILDLLGEAQPCGMIAPSIVEPPGDGTDGVVVIHEDTAGVYVGAEARAYAVLLLRAADQVEVRR